MNTTHINNIINIQPLSFDVINEDAELVLHVDVQSRIREDDLVLYQAIVDGSVQARRFVFEEYFFRSVDDIIRSYRNTPVSTFERMADPAYLDQLGMPLGRMPAS